MWGSGRLVMVGWSLLAGLVGPVPVVMAGILAEDRSQVAFVVDEYPVCALGPCCAYPSPGIAVRPRRLQRDLRCLLALAGEDLAEGGREPGVAIPDQEAGGPGLVAHVVRAENLRHLGRCFGDAVGAVTRTVPGEQV
jgi:hypothetical protein